MVTMATKLLEQNDSRWLAFPHEQAAVGVDRSSECKMIRVMHIIEYKLCVSRAGDVIVCVYVFYVSLCVLNAKDLPPEDDDWCSVT